MAVGANDGHDERVDAAAGVEIEPWRFVSGGASRGGHFESATPRFHGAK